MKSKKKTTTTNPVLVLTSSSRSLAFSHHSKLSHINKYSKFCFQFCTEHSFLSPCYPASILIIPPNLHFLGVGVGGGLLSMHLICQIQKERCELCSFIHSTNISFTPILHQNTASYLLGYVETHRPPKRLHSCRGESFLNSKYNT